MTDQAAPKRHPFLDDLAADVVLTTNVLRAPIEGREAVLKVVKAGGTLYATQKPVYLKKIDDHRSLFEYDADLVGGGFVHGIVVIDWNAAGSVSRLNIGFSPLTGALQFAAHLRETLSGDLSAALLL